MVCVQISLLFPGFPESEAEFLTFRREDFFAAGVCRASVAGIFLSSLVNTGFFSYLYISITGIFFLRANGLIPPSE
jgi:ABC-type Mn2+/Zn2+ transport system permease subunit